MAKPKRSKPESFFLRLRSGQQWLLLAIATGTAIGGVWAGTAAFERSYGIVAGQMGFARDKLLVAQMTTHKVEHKQATDKVQTQLNRIELWQLYDQIKRLTRQIEVLESKPLTKLSEVEREQLRDIKKQRDDAADDYKELSRKVKAGG